MPDLNPTCRRTAVIGHRHATGLTVIELMVGVAILAILVTVVMPGFGTVLQRNQMVTHVNDFILAIGLARSESVRRGQRVRVVATDDSANSNEWGPGWQVLDRDDNVIRTFGAISGGLVFNGPNGIDTLAFNSRGMLCDINGAVCDIPAVNTSGGSYDLCLDDDDIGIRIELSTIGRPSTYSLDGDGVCDP